MDMISPLTSDYMKEVKLDELIREEREARLCDAKIKLGQYITLHDSLFEETLEEETKDLLLEKRKRKLQILRNACRKLSI
ncbi:MAG: hypothetical protein E7Z91_01740 [Cyanobacteria bacterium SIG30]|nr:hypothetical protein [Cyanobacteria bacterium SIG30]